MSMGIRKLVFSKKKIPAAQMVPSIERNQNAFLLAAVQTAGKHTVMVGTGVVPAKLNLAPLFN